MTPDAAPELPLYWSMKANDTISLAIGGSPTDASRMADHIEGCLATAGCVVVDRAQIEITAKRIVDLERQINDLIASLLAMARLTDKLTHGEFKEALNHE